MSAPSDPDRSLPRAEPLSREERLAVHPDTPFGPWRSRLESERNGSRLLDLLLSPPDARALVQRLPVDDLHGLVHRIGLEDCTELLALVSSAQLKGMLDAEIWVRDRLSVERLDPWLNALMHAGPEVFFRRVLDLDDELLTWMVRRSVRTVVLEDPEDFNPPEEEHVVTPDGRLCVIFPEGEPRDLPVKVLLDGLMRQDAALCINLLLGAEAALDSVIEEEAYRWRTARMADRGYVDYYEALAIYAPPPKRPAGGRASVDGEAPHRWLAPVVGPEARLSAAFEALSAALLPTVQTELAFVANMALSADRIDPWDEEGHGQTLRRLRAGLVLGLDALGGGDAARDAQVLSETALALVFRHGYARMVACLAPLKGLRGRLRRGDDPVGQLDLTALRPWAEGLLAGRHPQLPSGQPLARQADLAEAERAALRLAELVAAAGPDRPAEVGLAAWLATAFARAAVGLEGDGPLPVAQLEAAHRALFAAGDWTPPARAAQAAFWTSRGGADHWLRDALFQQLHDELAAVRPSALEARFIEIWHLA